MKRSERWLPESPTGAPWMYQMTWNDELNGIVGRVDDATVLFDPLEKKILHRGPAGERGIKPSFSPGGRWLVEQKTLSPKPIEIAIHEIGPPWRSSIVVPTGSTVRAAPAWGPDGRLAVYTTDFERHAKLETPYIDPRFDFVERGEIVRTVPLDRRLAADLVFREVSDIQWSPAGDHIAAMVEGQQVQVFDWSTGETVHDFRATAPPPPPMTAEDRQRGVPVRSARPGVLLWAYEDRLVRMDDHFLSVWTVDGEKVGELVMPRRSEGSGSPP